MVIFAVELEIQYWQKASICYLSDGWGHDKEYCYKQIQFIVSYLVDYEMVELV